MRTGSLRTRMALTSAALLALVLSAFAGFAWGLTYRMSLARLDGFLRANAVGQLSPPPPDQRWPELERALNGPAGTDRERAVLIRVVDGGGTVLYQSRQWPAALDTSALRAPPAVRGPAPRPPFAGPLPQPPPPPPVAFVTLRAATDAWRFATVSDGWRSISIGAHVAAFAPEMNQLQTAFLLALPGGLVLVGLCSWLIANRALRPVRELASAVEGITERGLDARLRWPTSDREFQGLTASLNDMLARLERSFHQATRFSADSAHELRTPLTVLQGELEAALQDAEPGSSEQQTYGGLLEEVQRLKSIVQKLLLLSRADAGKLTLRPEPLDLAALAEALAEDIGAVAPDLSVAVDSTGPVWVNADPELLPHVTGNLVSNAVKYNQPHGRVVLSVWQAGRRAALRVANTGPPIPAEDRARVFDRFYRVDRVRGREVEGSGLGLSVGREIARAHDGDLVLEPDQNGMTAFRLELPGVGGTGL